MGKNKGFTLIELVVATTILSIIMLSVFTIYFNVVDANRKLELTRILQENSRNITETIAKDIREKGIDFSGYNPLYTESMDYANGNSFLKINDENLYCMINKDTPNSCSQSCLGDKNCYFGVIRGSTGMSISDDRVMINKMRFYISGTGSQDITNSQNEGKVTLVFELGIMPGKGLNSNVIKDTKLNIETTISEKVYKK